MNPRIKELIDRCTTKSTSYFDGRGNVTETYFDKEKFAKLIIQDCINVASKYDAPKMSGPGLVIGSMIAEHFGAEE